MDSSQKHVKEHPYLKANIFSKLFVWWLKDLFQLGMRKDLEMEDIYNTLPQDRSGKLGDQLERRWSKEVKSGAPSLARALIQTFRRSMLTHVSIYLIYCNVFRVGQPIFLSLMIESFYGEDARWYSSWYAVGLITCSLGCAFSTAQFWNRAREHGMRIRVAVSSLLYRKVLRLSRCTMLNATAVQVINLMANDAARFDEAPLKLSGLLTPLQAVVVTICVWLLMGISAVIGVVALTLLTFPLQMYFGKLSAKFRLMVAERTDRRILLLSEIITGAQMIKMYAWEKPFTKMVQLARRSEMGAVRNANYVQGHVVTGLLISDRIAMLFTLMPYVLLGQRVSAAQVYAVAELYNALKIGMAYFLPMALTTLGECKVSVDRIQKYLLLEEITTKAPCSTVDGECERGAVELNEVKASWHPTTAVCTLRDITLHIRPGTLCAVVGHVGSGKSSLLHTLLGELTVREGSLSMGGEVSYCGQEPWLFSGSVRMNILFGQDYKESHYRQVVHACALERDLQLLCRGDSTLVGEKGTSLSGGQRARVNLARAVYRKADIYLLDSPLSSVDSGVARQLFRDCIRTFLAGKTRILVTHQTQFLREADLIIVLNNGHIEAMGTFDELKADNHIFSRLIDSTDDILAESESLTEGSESVEKAEESEKQVEKQEAEEEGDADSETTELLAKGRVRRKVYSDYLLAGGSVLRIVMLVAVFVISHGILCTTDYWTAHWINHENSRPNFTPPVLEVKKENISLQIQPIARPPQKNISASEKIVSAIEILETLDMKYILNHLKHATVTRQEHHSLPPSLRGWNTSDSTTKIALRSGEASTVHVNGLLRGGSNSSGSLSLSDSAAILEAETTRFSNTNVSVNNSDPKPLLLSTNPPKPAMETSNLYSINEGNDTVHLKQVTEKSDDFSAKDLSNIDVNPILSNISLPKHVMKSNNISSVNNSDSMAPPNKTSLPEHVTENNHSVLPINNTNLPKPATEDSTIVPVIERNNNDSSQLHHNRTEANITAINGDIKELHIPLSNSKGHGESSQQKTLEVMPSTLKVKDITSPGPEMKIISRDVETADKPTHSAIKREIKENKSQGNNANILQTPLPNNKEVSNVKSKNTYNVESLDNGTLTSISDSYEEKNTFGQENYSSQRDLSSEGNYSTKSMPEQIISHLPLEGMSIPDTSTENVVSTIHFNDSTTHSRASQETLLIMNVTNSTEELYFSSTPPTRAVGNYVTNQDTVISSATVSTINVKLANSTTHISTSNSPKTMIQSESSTIPSNSSGGEVKISTSLRKSDSMKSSGETQPNANAIINTNSSKEGKLPPIFSPPSVEIPPKTVEHNRLSMASPNSPNGSVERNQLIHRNFHHFNGSLKEFGGTSPTNSSSTLEETDRQAESERYLWIYAALVGCTTVLMIFRTNFYMSLCARCSRGLHEKMFSAVLHTSMRFFDMNPAGRIMNRFSKDVGTVDEVIPVLWLLAIQAMVVGLGIIILAAMQSGWVLIPFVIAAGMLWKICQIYLATANDVKRLEGVARSPVYSHLSATLDGLATIRSSGMQSLLKHEFDDIQDQHTSAWSLTILANMFFNLWSDLACICFMTSVIAFFIVFANDMAPGAVGLAISQIMVLLGMVSTGMMFTTTASNMMVSVERMVQYCELQPEPGSEPGAGQRPPGGWPALGGIEIENLDVSYTNTGPLVLRNTNLTIKPGEKVGVVGRTGAGKTSLALAVLRIVCSKGTVKIDGTDISRLSLKDLREKISIIPQQPILFSVPLRVNLDPTETIPDAQLWQALSEVELKDSLANLDFVLNERGSTFSAGQRQLLCLARVILRKNKILILDEATANMDPRTDGQIQSVIRLKFKDCTVITIAHRLNTIMDSDKVLVLDNGEVMEFDHPHLLLQNSDGFLSNMLQKTDEGTANHLRKMAAESYKQKCSGDSQLHRED